MQLAKKNGKNLSMIKYYYRMYYQRFLMKKTDLKLHARYMELCMLNQY